MRLGRLGVMLAFGVAGAACASLEAVGEVAVGDAGATPDAHGMDDASVRGTGATLGRGSDAQPASDADDPEDAAGHDGGDGSAGDAAADAPGVVACPPFTEGAAPHRVVTGLGALDGVDAGGGVSAFLGVPFALPPTGARRFRAPEPAGCLDAPLAADGFGSVCWQRDRATGLVEGDEDCLTLNVWAPTSGLGGEAPPRPVMVFVHGGGNVLGASSQTLPGGAAIYGGRRLAMGQDVVVVTVNYRLGPFGWLTLPELDAEAGPGQPATNFGLLDQIEALRWVQTHIAAFGGDPERVMVFGESAGAANTCALLAAPETDGLMHAALLQSGGCTRATAAARQPVHTAAVDEGTCGPESGGDRVACLRDIPAATVFADLEGTIDPGAVSGGMGGIYGPVVDGVVLDASPGAVLESGSRSDVAVVVGSNLDELAEMLGATVFTEAGFSQTVTQFLAPLGPQAARWTADVLEAYPIEDFASPQEALVAVFSDMRFTCPARRVARAAAAGGHATWRYLFARRSPLPSGGLKLAVHGVELLYVFGSFDDLPFYSAPEDDVALAGAMQAAWAALARHGDPDPDQALGWPGYGSGADGVGDPTLWLDGPRLGVTPVDGFRSPQCDVWDALDSLLGG